MAKSDNEQQFDTLLSTMRDSFKKRAWRKSRYRFNRRTDSDVVQVIHFQLGRADPPGVVPVPPIRQDVAGLFTTEIGVYLEAVDPPLAKGRFLSAWDCAVRLSPSELSEQYTDHWWANQPEVAPAFADFVDGTIYPLLEKLETTDLVLEHLPIIAPGLRQGTGCPWRYLLSRIYLARGDHDEAQSWFNKHWIELSERWPDSRKFEGLATWASKHNLQTPNKSEQGNR